MASKYQPSASCPICHPNLLTAETWLRANRIEEVEYLSNSDSSTDNESETDSSNSKSGSSGSESDSSGTESDSSGSKSDTSGSKTGGSGFSSGSIHDNADKNKEKNEKENLGTDNAKKEIDKKTTPESVIDDDNKMNNNNAPSLNNIKVVFSNVSDESNTAPDDERIKRQTGRRPQPRQAKKKLRTNQDGHVIKMPSGQKYWMPIPETSQASPKFRCGNWTKLVTLDKFRKSRGSREYQIIEHEMQNTIVQMNNCEDTGGCFDKYNIIKIQRIVQGCVWRRYQNRKLDVEIENNGDANERMLFHGTRAVWAIVRQGFDERYASTDGQFGAGLYFADRSSICNQFVFGLFGGDGCPKHKDKNCYICESAMMELNSRNHGAYLPRMMSTLYISILSLRLRHLLLCRVILGNAEKLSYAMNMAHPPRNRHSVEATPSPRGFLYPEYVVYRGEQTYPEYLITYKIVKPLNSTSDASERDGTFQKIGKSGFNKGNGR